MVVVEETTAQPVDQGCATKSGRLRKLCDSATKFPDTSHVQSLSAKRFWIRPFYYDKVSIIDHLGFGLFYQESRFSKNVVETSMDAVDVDEPIKKWDDEDQP